ncbi:RES domain-containing protein [Leifsonia sp. TF02-11]|uniref:RES domain-containing protein n=1 Tax=Leifsonia sp. TF02-11 TaxID=2815212 RepID=UPI001AA112A9|nr:RES domain-containing protein [Leifsonia sp. TF02-11]MBO1740939.1 RES domain-containing protein [Leifsonia sp. TF02-11]
MISVVDAAGRTVWRVGRAPDPWAWIDRQYAGHQRWDDAGGIFRTVYAGDSLYSCFVEVLAYSRPDIEPDGSDLLAGIVEDPEDAAVFPTRAAGSIPRDWIGGRMVTTARLTGPYADVRTSDTIAALRPGFLRLALQLGYPDFDAAALKSADPRELTQRVASFLYALTDDQGGTVVDGVRFGSRHGDELSMWAIFERPGDEPASHHLMQTTAHLVDVDDPDLHRAMILHRLSWRD